jgi:hypothetical protein
VSDSDGLRRLMISAEPDKQVSVAILRGEEAQTVSITPQSIAGPVLDDYPASWDEAESPAWETNELKLPDAGNAAAYVAPKVADETQQLGLLILLLSPSQGSPSDALESWPELASKSGVVVCAIAPDNSRRWQPKEIEVVSNFVAALVKKGSIDSSAVAIASSGALAGGSAEAADAMALAVAIAKSSTFFGVAVSPKTRPPAVRLRENKASEALQLLLPIEVGDELPPWSIALKKAGYPIVRGGKTSEDTLLKWVRLLQSI